MTYAKLTLPIDVVTYTHRVDESIIGRKRKNATDCVEEEDLIMLKFRYEDIETLKVYWKDVEEPTFEKIDTGILGDYRVPLNIRRRAYDNRFKRTKRYWKLYTNFIGDASAMPNKVTGFEFFTTTPTRYQAEDVYCLPYAVLNSANDPSEITMKKLIEAFGSTHGDIFTLARATNSIKTQLHKISNHFKTLDWLLSQISGIYILHNDHHCISVDVERKLIFDCGYAFALSLNREAMIHCGFECFRHIRKIEFPPYLRFPPLFVLDVERPCPS